MKIRIVRPTKMELARLKKRLRLARKVRQIVRDRLAVLVAEFMQAARECRIVKERQVDEYRRAAAAMSVATAYLGGAALDVELPSPGSGLALDVTPNHVTGVQVPLFRFEGGKSAVALSGADGAVLLTRAGSLAATFLATTVELAQLEQRMVLLGREIRKVKRINNALEHVVVPSLEESILYLAMKFEERDREEAARLKRVKMLIEEREAHAY